MRRRLYRAPDGGAHFLLDEHLGWLPGQVATPAFAALVVDWATDLPFRTAARRVGEATAGAVSGSTAWRLLQQVAQRVTAQEAATHATWARTAALPPPVGARVVPVLYLEADGVWVKTQREPAHRTGYELKCASMYEGWRRQAGPTAGHPRPHYRLGAKRVYCHGHAQAAARAPIPFWEAVSLALAPTYDLSRIPLVVVGGDGANWLDAALEGFPQAVRQRDGFHLARDAARGWGPDAGATLYQAVRTGDQATAARLLALPAPPMAPRLPPPPAAPPPATVPGRAPPRPALVGGPAPPGAGDPRQPGRVPRRRHRSARPGAAGVGARRCPRARHDGRHQRPPAGQAHEAQRDGLAHRRRPGHGQDSRTGHQRGARPLVSPLASGRGPPVPRVPGGFAPAGPLPWPQVSVPAAQGPRSGATAARLHRIDTGGRSRHRLT